MPSFNAPFLAPNATRLAGLRGDAACLFVAEMPHRVVWITAEEKKLRSIGESLRSFAPDKRICILPPRSGTPYVQLPQHEITLKDRITCLARVKSGAWDLLVTTADSLIERFPPKDRLLWPCRTLQRGAECDPSQLIRDLDTMAFRRVELVSQVGEFASRGGIVDVFPLTETDAIRLEFFADEIEDIRRFDPSTQRSIEPVEEITLLPHAEWCMTPETSACFSRNGQDLWNASPSRNHFLTLVDQLNQLRQFPGYEHWTPLFFEETSAIDAFLPDDAILYLDDLSAIEEALEDQVNQLALQEEEATKRREIFAPVSRLFRMPSPDAPIVPESRKAILHDMLALSGADRELVTKTVPRYHGRVSHFLRDTAPQADRDVIVLVMHHSRTREKMADLLAERGISFHLGTFPLTGGEPPGFRIVEGVLEGGFAWPDRHLVIFDESDLWDAPSGPVRRKAPRRLFQSDFRDLKVGDLVIHDDHGVGKFLGLVDMDAGGKRHEMMALAYRDGNRLYLSLGQLHKIQRVSSEDKAVSLDKLGGVTWEKKRRRVTQSVKKLAIDLLKLYAEREVSSPLKCGPDTPWQREFEDQFAFELTPDQAQSIDEVKRALETSNRPMDRLLVGDVGFGKTEVAMRAAFKIVMEGGQVAVLCPTTVLAFQHFMTFSQRFAPFPVTIRWLSRFSKAGDRRSVLEEVATGTVDILIGTHRLLSSDVAFKRLACLIIDEEQRFGVGHKEKLKHAKKGIHVLSMSATPIPRSLHMAFSGIREISVIQTPPRNRLSICTSVLTYRPALVKNAIDFELGRKGQVYFVHNRVETMDSLVATLRELLPYATIEMAHGQMESRRLEAVMLRFIRHDIDVLVASTIIENGLDIANANTMIIHRADTFGMSQLYQLRGRIGRSEKPSFAYLLVPPRQALKGEARKRLAALEEFSDLGSGFRIAALDLEIRGTGNLLGPEQAGHIHAVGLDLYLRMLRRAVRELQGLADEEPTSCSLSLKTEAEIPRAYMPGTNQRIHYYRRLSCVTAQQDVDDIAQEIADCYGPLPDELDALLGETLLRIDLAAHGIVSVDREGAALHIRLRADDELPQKAAHLVGFMGSEAHLSLDGTIVMPIDQVADSRSLVAALRRIFPATPT